MQDAISLSVTPFQAILALVFQVWIVVFPIMIMRKIDRLTNFLEDRFGDSDDDASGQGADSGKEEV